MKEGSSDKENQSTNIIGYVSAGLISSQPKLIHLTFAFQELRAEEAHFSLPCAHIKYLGSSYLSHPQGHTYFIDTYL